MWELRPGVDSSSLGSYWPPVALHLGLRPCGICPIHIGMIDGIVIIAGRIQAVIFWEFLNAASSERCLEAVSLYRYSVWPILVSRSHLFLSFFPYPNVYSDLQPCIFLNIWE